MNTEPSPHSRTMNTLIAAGFKSKSGTVGTFARTGGTPTPTNSSQRERLSAALDDLEAAEKAGDEDRIHLASFMVERLRGEAQAGRGQPSEEQPRNPDGTFAGGFDGGVRKTLRKAPGMNEFIQNAARSGGGGGVVTANIR